jgi:hypothetical protein
MRYPKENPYYIQVPGICNILEVVAWQFQVKFWKTSSHDSRESISAASTFSG